MADSKNLSESEAILAKVGLSKGGNTSGSPISTNGPSKTQQILGAKGLALGGTTIEAEQQRQMEQARQQALRMAKTNAILGRQDQLAPTVYGKSYDELTNAEKENLKYMGRTAQFNAGNTAALPGMGDYMLELQRAQAEKQKAEQALTPVGGETPDSFSYVPHYDETAPQTDKNNNTKQAEARAVYDAIMNNDLQALAPALTGKQFKDLSDIERQELQMQLTAENKKYAGQQMPVNVMSHDEILREMANLEMKIEGSDYDPDNYESDRANTASRYTELAKQNIALGGGGVTRTVLDATIGYEADLMNYGGTVAKWLSGGKIGNKLQGAADTLSDFSSADINAMKNEYGKLGDAAVDIGMNLVQMAYDAGLGNAIRGAKLIQNGAKAAGFAGKIAKFVGGRAGLIPMFFRSAGGGMREARLAQDDDGNYLNPSELKQVLYGNAAGLVETLTEMIGDGVAGIYGKAASKSLEETVEKFITKTAKTSFGRIFLRSLKGAFDEGFEEVVSDIANPFISLIYNNKALEVFTDSDKRSDYLSEMWYDFIIGAAVSGVTGTASTTMSVAGDTFSNVEVDGLKSILNLKDAMALEDAREHLQNVEYFDKFDDFNLDENGNTEQGKELNKASIAVWMLESLGADLNTATEMYIKGQQGESTTTQENAQEKAETAQPTTETAQPTENNAQQTEETAQPTAETAQPKTEAETTDFEAEIDKAAAGEAEEGVKLESLDDAAPETAESKAQESEAPRAQTLEDLRNYVKANVDGPIGTVGNYSYTIEANGTVTVVNDETGKTVWSEAETEGRDRVDIITDVINSDAFNNAFGQLKEGENNEEGTNVSDGRQGRESLQRSGKQSKGISRESKSSKGRTAQEKAADRRRNAEEIRSVEEVECSTLTKNGSNGKVRVVPETAYDKEIKKAAETIEHDTGIKPVFVVGELTDINYDPSVGKEVETIISGYYGPDAKGKTTIIVRADHEHFTVEQLAAHEAFHAIKEQNPGILQDCMDELAKKIDPDRLRAIIHFYAERQHLDAELGCEEMMADIYADNNRYALSAPIKGLHDIITPIVDERLGKDSQSQGTQETNGPNETPAKGITELQVNDEGESIATLDDNTESVAARFSRDTWEKSDYVTARNQAAKDIADRLDISVEKAKAYIDDINTISAMIGEDLNRLDYRSSPGRSSFVSNVEYGGSFDFSTLCKKRRLITGTLSAIQKALPNTVLSAQEILDIRNMMKDAGLEVNCGLCYVEGSRANMGVFTNEFLKLYKKYNPGAWTPNMAEMNTPDGIEQIRIQHPEVYEQYEKFWNNYGRLTNDDPTLFASQQKPKLYQLRTEYKGEILTNFKDSDKIAEKNKNGGIRCQSFSDFEIVHLIDMMQIVMDMSRVGLAGQAYTKVPEFAWALGDTGMKINLSLIAKDVDEDGNLVFDDVEGMPYETAMELRDEYPENVGTIIVVFTDAQLKAAMADDTIDYIIPFHRSQWKKSQYADMGLPKNTKDFTYMQNEKFMHPNEHTHEFRGRIVKDKASNYMPNEYWDFSKSGKENAETYLRMCAEADKRPKFYKLLDKNGDGSYSLKADGSTDGYWKLLIDFKMYDNDGVGSPQLPVKPQFNMDKAQEMLNNYKGGHEQFPVAQDIVKKFVDQKKAEERPIKLGKNPRYSAEEYEELAKDPEANETQLQEIVDNAAEIALPNSKIRMPDGKLRKVYHGTNTGDFTVFNPDYIGMSSGDDGFFGMGFYFAYSEGEASYYGAKRLISAFIDMRNPFNFEKEFHTYNGERARSGYAPDAVALMNFAEKFPEMAKSEEVTVVEQDSYESKTISLAEFSEAFKNTIENTKFEYQKVKNEFGEDETLVLADKEEGEYEFNGKVHKYVDYGFKQRFYGNDVNPLDAAYEYFSNNVYRYVDLPRFTSVILYNNREFTQELKNRGYDGTIQSEAGDEVCAFYPEQIKSADPVTYDDAGNVIPLEERFNTSNPDIRYSTDESEVDFYDMGEHITEGAYIDDSRYAYSEPIKAGDKLGETRFKKTAIFENAYKNGKRIALVRSGIKGKLAAYATAKIGKPVWIAADEWNENRYEGYQHYVPENSDYDLKEGEPGKWFYPFEDLHVLDNEVKPKRNSAYGAKFSSDDSERDLAPTFYSQMENVISEKMPNKMAADQVEKFLLGKGVKAEEIKWSGIKTFMEGKKSVTKDELLNFARENQIQIEETTLTGDEQLDRDALYDAVDEQVSELIPDYFITYNLEVVEPDDPGTWVINYTTEDGTNSSMYVDELQGYTPIKGMEGHSRWGEYKSEGGQNYREFIYSLPNSDYSNDSMNVHWGREGVIAHARIQEQYDGTTGEQILFIEEIQSDWNNEGNKRGFLDSKKLDQALDRFKISKQNRDELWLEYVAVEEEAEEIAKRFRPSSDSTRTLSHITAIFEAYDKPSEELKALYGATDEEISVLQHYADLEYLYDIYRDETETSGNELDIESRKTPDAPYAGQSSSYVPFVLKNLLRKATEEGFGRIGWTTAQMQSERWSDEYAEGYRIEYDQEIPKFLRKYGKQWGAEVGKSTLMSTGEEIWAMDITPEMKESVLYKGQPRYSADESENSVEDTSEGEYNEDIIEKLKPEVERNTYNGTRQRENAQDFSKRIKELGYARHRAGNTTIGVKKPTSYGRGSKEAGRGLRDLGIDIFFYDDLEINTEGFTETIRDDIAVTLPEFNRIGIKSGFERYYGEVVNHEAYHFLSDDPITADYRQLLADSCANNNTKAFSELFYGVLDRFENFNFSNNLQEELKIVYEEVYATVTGMLDSLRTEAQVNEMFSNADEIRSEWQKVISERQQLPKGKTRYSADDSEGWTGTKGLNLGGLTVDEYMKQAKARAEAAKQERIRTVSKADFKGSEALNNLGIKVAGSVGQYANIKTMLEVNRKAKAIQKQTDRAEARLRPTPVEKEFAKGMAAGLFKRTEIPGNMERGKVIELAEHYYAERMSNSDILIQQKRAISSALQEKMQNIFGTMETKKLPKLLIMNFRTPKRIMHALFGHEAGERVFNEIFEPVQVNEAERFRFVNRMFDEVQKFKDSKGKMSGLTKDERALVMHLIEGRAAAEMIASMEMGEAIKNAANNVFNNDGDLTEEARAFGLGTRETQLAKQYADLLEFEAQLNSPKVDSTRVNNAVEKYKEQFNKFYDAINDFLAAHGYEPIGFIKGYAPHLQPEENQTLLDRAFDRLGLNTDVTRLPTEIAGLTASYKPNKRWNPYFLTRTGSETQYDIASAYESYVRYMSDILYHTDDIMRVRQMSNWFRSTYSKTNNSELIEQAMRMQTAPVANKRTFLETNGMIENGSPITDKEVGEKLDAYVEKLFADLGESTTHGDLVMWLDNYANILAGKQSMGDRGGEYTFGRKFLNFGNKLTRTFGMAQVAGKVSSALNQMAQLPFIYGELGARYTLGAAFDMATGKLRRANFADESDFLTGKKGLDFIVTDTKTMVTRALFWPAEFMDNMLSTLAVRGAYIRAINNGMNHTEALRAADEFGNEIMGSRMKGTKPVNFESKNPLMRMMTMFQVEALNTWDHIVSDLPRDFQIIEKEQGRAKASLALAGVILRSLLAAFALNRLDDELYGGTPTPFDIIGLSANFIASGNKLTTNEFLMEIIDNVTEKYFDERIFGSEVSGNLEDGDFDWKAAVDDTSYNVVSDVPLIRNIMTLLGIGDNSSLPMAGIATYNDVKDAFDKTLEGKGNSTVWMKALGTLASEMLPGGSQAKKTIEGLKVYNNGGKFNSQGQLQYSIDKTDPMTAARLALFGQYSTPESAAYYAHKDSALTDGQMKMYNIISNNGNYTSTEVESMIRNFIQMKDEFIDKKQAEGGSNKLTQEDAKTLISEMDGSNYLKAVIWQCIDSGWKPDKNPFNTSIGRQIYDATHDKEGKTIEADLTGLSLPSLG